MVAKLGRMRDHEGLMSKDDGRFLEKPGHLIRRLQQISLALFMDQTQTFDITPVQYSAMIAIGNHPGIDQTALCNIIAFDRSTIGDVVSRLEKKKLIRRLSGHVDRRTKSLYITPSGRRLLRDIEPAVQSTQRLILAPLKSSERNAFMQMLKHLVHLNNEHSRAPLRPKDARHQRRRPAARPVNDRRAAPSPLRARSKNDTFADS
jgi:MarR family transcriptional regulator, lower aerobic nicotinate degradation pathway regulator